MLKRMPEDAKAIVDSLGDFGCFVENYSSQYMGWAMEVLVKTKRFNLVKEGHQVFVTEVIGDAKYRIWPKDENFQQATPSDVAKVIKSKIA